MKNTTLYKARNLDGFLSMQGRKKRWLADQVGVHEASISRIAAGKQATTEDVAKKIADVLQVPVPMLFDVLERPELILEGKTAA